ncbi:MAG: hypothetical protein HYS55_05855 [Candidatus Omnitrophica bacterium]|nr:hypothetical protein [Candidatus Omnitrophota bacterium]
MSPIRALFLSVCFLFLCALSACKTTESQIRAMSPELREQMIAMEKSSPSEAVRAPEKANKLQWFLLTAVILGTVVMVFASDRAPQKKEAAVRKRASSKRRRRK